MGKVKLTLKCINDVYSKGDYQFKKGKVYDALKDSTEKRYKITDEFGETVRINYFTDEEVNWVKKHFLVKKLERNGV